MRNAKNRGHPVGRKAPPGKNANCPMRMLALAVCDSSCDFTCGRTPGCTVLVMMTFMWTVSRLRNRSEHVSADPTHRIQGKLVVELLRCPSQYALSLRAPQVAFSSLLQSAQMPSI